MKTWKTFVELAELYVWQIQLNNKLQTFQYLIFLKKLNFKIPSYGYTLLKSRVSGHLRRQINF